MKQACVLALAAVIAACGIGDTIVLGATDLAGGAGGAGGSSGISGGQGGTAGAMMDASATPLPDAASDAQDGDASDGSAPTQCVAADPSAPVALCTRVATTTSLDLTPIYAWPTAGVTEVVNLALDSTPLVANFTDDNADGRIDVCDVPDVLVRGFDDEGSSVLYLVSGDSGVPLRQLATPVAALVEPAIADLDRDGTVEVITFSPDGQLLVLDERGEIERRGDTSSLWNISGTGCIAMGVAELDGDDTPEILAGYDVFNHDGTLRFSYGGDIADLSQSETVCHVAIASNLDNDGAQEVIFPLGVMHRSTGELIGLNLQAGSLQLADVMPGRAAELVIASDAALTVVSEGGSAAITIPGLCTSAAFGVGDLDGDRLLDLAFGNCGVSAGHIDGSASLSTLWQSTVSPSTGRVDVFDLLGDGSAEVLHLSSDGLYILDGATGNVLERRIEELSPSIAFGGPVIADVDNDGSADVLVIAETDEGVQLVALSSTTKAFAPVRRIYNQYANQVTHIDETGLIVPRPQPFPFSHQNAQIEGDRLCFP